MGLGCTDFTLVMFMKGSGLMGNPMAVGHTLLRMGVSMLGSSSGASSMGLVITITGNFFGTPRFMKSIECGILMSIFL